MEIRRVSSHWIWPGMEIGGGGRPEWGQRGGGGGRKGVERRTT
jgi:hypothetical protein